jgi:Tfp pilus assembly protein PilV
MGSIHGVSLVEVLIALTILLIVFMGLIQASLVSIQSNMRNLLRDEAVAITSEQISELRGAEYDDMNADDTIDAANLNLPAMTVTRNYRNAAAVNFGIARNIQALDANNKQITVTTTWQWQGEGFQHQIMTTRQR